MGIRLWQVGAFQCCQTSHLCGTDLLRQRNSASVVGHPFVVAYLSDGSSEWVADVEGHNGAGSWVEVGFSAVLSLERLSTTMILRWGMSVSLSTKDSVEGLSF